MNSKICRQCDAEIMFSPQLGEKMMDKPCPECGSIRFMQAWAYRRRRLRSHQRFE